MATIKRRRTALTLGTAVAAALLVSACGPAGRLARSAELARASEPLQQRPAQAALRLLVVGDSTGVGTGASAPQASLVGLIAAAHPRLWIENRSRDGARFADVATQLGGAERFDVVLVLAGGNDVIRLTGETRLRQEIEAVAAGASRLGGAVVMMPPGNVGNAPFFFPPLSWWMTARSQTLHDAVREVAMRHGAVYVNLYQSREDDPFAQRRDLNAADGLHPSDAGYRLWHAQLQAQADFDGLLSRAREPRVASAAGAKGL